MFLRSSKVVWGIGLLSVTTAVLLDTFLGVFEREAILAQLGFFFYVFAGIIMGGMIAWLLGILRPILVPILLGKEPVAVIETPMPVSPRPMPPPSTQQSVAIDRKLLRQDMTETLTREDLLDVLFDLGINENELVAPNQTNQQLAQDVITYCERRDQLNALAFAVERALTPIASENLPRLEKLSVDTPAPVLRQYLLTKYDLAQTRDIALALGLKWDEIGYGNAQNRVRNLLIYLQRRNRLPDLLAHMQQEITTDEEEVS